MRRSIVYAWQEVLCDCVGVKKKRVSKGCHWNAYCSASASMRLRISGPTRFLRGDGTTAVCLLHKYYPWRPRSFLPHYVPTRTMIAAPKAGDGPLLERRADRALPGGYIRSLLPPPLSPPPQKKENLTPTFTLWEWQWQHRPERTAVAPSGIGAAFPAGTRGKRGVHLQLPEAAE